MPARPEMGRPARLEPLILITTTRKGAHRCPRFNREDKTNNMDPKVASLVELTLTRQGAGPNSPQASLSGPPHPS